MNETSCWLRDRVFELTDYVEDTFGIRLEEEEDWAALRGRLEREIFQAYQKGFRDAEKKLSEKELSNDVKEKE